MGPNVRRLIAEKMATDAIPPGGGIVAGVEFLSNPKAVTEGAKTALTWVAGAINAVRKCEGENPYSNADDETIAGAILERIKTKREEMVKRLSGR